jgi:DNA-binding beta-propeller fold protein YncE
MTMWRGVALLAAALAGLAAAPNARAQWLISGNDEKVAFDPDGKRTLQPAGKDTVSIIDIRDRLKPKIVANLPMMNTITGPPVNLAISRDQRLALVANSLDWVKDGDSWKGVPDSKVYVIDLTVSPPAQIATVETGKQPSGLAINRAGTLALVANQADDTVSVLTIEGVNVKLAGSVALGVAGGEDKAPPARPAAVAITPDGKHALVVETGANRVALLDIDGTKVTPTQVAGKDYAVITGLRPINVQITPDGKLGLVNNIGGGQDGQVDTLAVIDLTANPPRVIDQVAVGDGPEGLAVSPAGGYAASLILNGTGATPKSAFFRHEHSYVALLKIAGKSVKLVAEIPVGRLAEGIAFSPDGQFLYVGNFVDGTLDILGFAGATMRKAGSLKMPGHPASLRGSTP